MTPEHAEAAKTLGDIASYSIVLGVLVNLLPTVATILSIVWLCIQISQSERFKQFAGWIGGLWRRWRER